MILKLAWKFTVILDRAVASTLRGPSAGSMEAGREYYFKEGNITPSRCLPGVIYTSVLPFRFFFVLNEASAFARGQADRQTWLEGIPRMPFQRPGYSKSRKFTSKTTQLARYHRLSGLAAQWIGCPRTTAPLE